MTRTMWTPLTGPKHPFFGILAGFYFMMDDFINLTNMESASRFQLPNCLHHNEHTWSIMKYILYTSPVFKVLPEVLESFPYHYQNHYQKQWASDLQHTNQGTNQAIRFVRMASSPQFFWHFSETAQDSGDWWVGRMAACLESQKWSEFARRNVQYMLVFSKPWRWKMPWCSCTFNDWV